jgi:hypothetical protein
MLKSVKLQVTVSETADEVWFVWPNSQEIILAFGTSSSPRSSQVLLQTDLLEVWPNCKKSTLVLGGHELAKLWGAFTLDVKSVLNEMLSPGGILGGMQC